MDACATNYHKSGERETPPGSSSSSSSSPPLKRSDSNEGGFPGVVKEKKHTSFPPKIRGWKKYRQPAKGGEGETTVGMRDCSFRYCTQMRGRKRRSLLILFVARLPILL